MTETRTFVVTVTKSPGSASPLRPGGGLGRGRVPVQDGLRPGPSDGPHRASATF